MSWIIVKNCFQFLYKSNSDLPSKDGGKAVLPIEALQAAPLQLAVVGKTYR
jgi:hypothetical protein